MQTSVPVRSRAFVSEYEAVEAESQRAQAMIRAEVAALESEMRRTLALIHATDLL